MLNMRFQVFPFAREKVQAFSSDRKILMSLLSVLFHLQNRVSVFWNLIFWGKYSLCPWNQPHFLKNSDKSVLSPEQNKLKEIWDRVCGRKTAENKNVKIKVSPTIPCTFLLVKASAFFKFSFREIYFSSKFWERQFFSIVNVWHSVTY